MNVVICVISRIIFPRPRSVPPAHDGLRSINRKTRSLRFTESRATQNDENQTASRGIQCRATCSKRELNAAQSHVHQTHTSPHLPNTGTAAAANQTPETGRLRTQFIIKRYAIHGRCLTGFEAHHHRTPLYDALRSFESV